MLKHITQVRKDKELLLSEVKLTLKEQQKLLSAATVCDSYLCFFALLFNIIVTELSNQLLYYPVPQIANQPITWQLLTTFRHVHMVTTTC